MTLDEILGGLNPEQAAAARTLEGPLLVLAGAGTGKTRVITYRIAAMLASGILPEQILGLTFTNKAAREMRERLAGLVSEKQAQGVTLGTFHSFCVRLLRKEGEKLGYLPGFTIADESDQQGLLKQSGAELGLLPGTYSIPETVAVISNWKNRLLTPLQARNQAENDREVLMGTLYGEYQKRLEMQNMVDFDDMLMLVWRLFTEFPEVLSRCQERYTHLLVDEYQDTSAAQFEVVRLLAGERKNLCVVGDDDQSIYSWRGADIGNILAFPEQFPGTKVIKLEQNYRSTSRILEAANAVLAGAPRRHEKKLWSSLGEGEPVRLVLTDNSEEEAQFAANCILQERGKSVSRKYADFAVLYRSNHLSRESENAFRKAGIPYRLVGGQEFYKRKEIKDAAAYLRLLLNPRDNQSLLRILPCPPRGLADKAVKLLKQHSLAEHVPMTEILGVADFQAALGSRGAQAAADLSKVIHEYREKFRTPGNLARLAEEYLAAAGYLDGLQKMYKDFKDAAKRRENVDEFINAIAQFEQHAGEPQTLEAYMESFALLEENDRTEETADGDAVTLSTVHAAKGLEYPVVLLAGMEQGLFPHARALEEGSAEEELRLFYVAVTRAREKLFLSRAKMRMERGVPRMPRASEFLTLLGNLAEKHEPRTLLAPPDEATVKKAFADIFKLLDEE